MSIKDSINNSKNYLINAEYSIGIVFRMLHFNLRYFTNDDEKYNPSKS